MKRFLTIVLSAALVSTIFLSSCKKNEENNNQQQDVNKQPVEDLFEEYQLSPEDAEKQKDYQFEVTGHPEEFDKYVARITKYVGDAKEVIVPDTLIDPEYGDICEVFYIDDGAFMGNETVETVVLPNTVVSIGVGAFQSCTALKAVAVGESLLEIDDRAFFGSLNLEKIGTLTAQQEGMTLNERIVNGLPKTVNSIGTMAFSSYGIEIPWYANLKDKNVIVGDGVLLKYNGKGNVEFGEEVKHVAYYAFKDAKDITIKFAPSLETIADFAIFNSTGLTVQVHASDDFVDALGYASDVAVFEKYLLEGEVDPNQPVVEEETAE